MAIIKVGINGFGRIGRRVFRLLLQHPEIEVVAINDIADAKTLSHLLKYDSIHGVLHRKVESTTHSIKVDDTSYPFTSKPAISDIPWQGVDIVIEATGKFKSKLALEQHISSGAKKVILCVPPVDDQIKMIVAGVNDHMLTPEDCIISNASCTTNNAAPMLKLIHDAFQIEQAYITTVHSYTTDQSLHDQPHKDLRRARAAGQSIVPTTTGAAKALTKLFPDLNNVIGGCGIRVPVANGSLCDITLNVKKKTSIQEVNTLFEKAANGPLKGILEFTQDPIVSIDIVGNTHSCVLDSEMTSVIGKMIKIIGWYDNETGYSSRIIDLVYKISRK
ncbi:type I glyceraldehyde-3-phosphate dehydrogenase [Flavobacteriaceae bacterium]|jgi:glyceraldehyde 3-phosphate dehydrogenase|nr:type I glyceraldehyde-3-phosphate dehydrogenase [Flavobacteriaceae bacterium]MDB4325456.1 type I glyceraldehyde-3-phosphate dehydrogenase [Flavobacteriaceae bacterium]MDG1502842.1 type I glyceraldehyde-3-phosphate dehydrogenase [Ulvibacter sp.]